MKLNKMRWNHGNAGVPLIRSKSSSPGLKFLLDEHYPDWLAQSLRDRGLDVASLIKGRPGLLGANDTEVLKAATAEGRILITEDVRTFGFAATQIEDHVGIIYCYHARFPRTRSSLKVLEKSLIVLAADPPVGLGTSPIVWWLTKDPG